MPEPVTEPGASSTRDDHDLSMASTKGDAGPAPRQPRWVHALGVGLLVLVLLVAVPSGALGAPVGVHTSTVPGGYAPLANGAGPLPLGAQAVSAVAATTPFTFNVEINIPTTPAEQAFQTGLLTPGSPYYHQFTPRGYAFVNAWGPSPSTVSALRAYFQSYGLQVTQLDQLGLIYGVRGTTAQVDAALHTQLWHYDAPGATGVAPDTVPYLPSSLAPWVEGFHLLNSFANPKPLYQLASVVPGIHAAAVTPSGMQGAYSAASLISGGDTGSQYVIGLAEMCDPTQASSTYQTDVNSFDSANSLAADTVTTSGSGASSCTTGSSGWGVETDLDVQSSHSLAPGSKQNICLDNTDPSICDSSFISGGIEFGSNSWGSSGNTFASIWNTAESSGVDLLASAGDSCAGLSGSPTNGISYPAAEEYGVAVGGTTLTVSGTSWGGETVWGTGCTSPGAGGGSGGGTGGGCDPTTASPPYQSGMTGYPGACSSGNRGYPDVAADADPNSGMNIYIQNAATNCGGMDPCQIGGTSLACPLWAASLDLIYQASGFTGYATSKLYSIAKSASYSTNFHDITSGSNGYTATVGWDPATGVGSPIIGSLVTGFNSPLTASLTPTASTVESGQTVQLTTTAGGGTPGYSYAWQQNGTPISGAPNGAVLNYTQYHSAPAPYLVSVVVTDSKGSTVTAGPASITVTPGPAVALTANRTTVDGGQKIGLSAVASGGSGTFPTYDWMLNGTIFSSGASPTATWTAPSHTFTGSLGVKVLDSLGGAAVASATVNVYATPGVLLTLSAPGPIDVLSAITLTATATGGAPPQTFAFLQNGTTTLQTGAGNTCPWTPSGPGTYTLAVKLTDGLGFSASSLPQTVTVYPNPYVSIGLPSASSVDAGALVTVQATAGGGTAPLSFAWTLNGAVVSGATSATLKFKAAAPGTDRLSVQVTDGVGRTATSTQVSLTVNPDPTLTIQGSTTVVAGQTDTLSAMTTGGTAPFRFVWTGTTDAATDNSGVSNFSSSSTGTYPVTVVASDSGGGSVTGIINITVTPAPAWYDTPFVPGTSSATVSWALLLGIVVAVIVVAVVVRRHRKRASGGTAAGAPPPGPYAGYGGPPPGNLSYCGACGSPNAWGAPSCASCGNPIGGAPPMYAPAPYGGPPPGYAQPPPPPQ